MTSDDGKAGASHRFLPIIREGFRPDTLFDADRTTIDGPSTFGVDLAVSANPKEDGAWESDPTPIGTEDGPTHPSKQIQMYGPGDIVGIDREQVVRVEPEPNSSSFPQNLFPSIEFDSPDLPWLFSPERADEQEGKARNRPWLTLVVVEKGADGVTVTGDGPGDLPVLEAPPEQLPPIEDVWAWAHAQVVGDDASVKEIVQSDPSRAVSRLVCPRNLAEKTDYVAAVVPTFEPGRRAGLGRDPYPDSADAGENGETGGNNGESNGNGSGNDDGIPTREIELAWSSDSSEPLPVYYMWEFKSGTADFERLIDRLEPERLREWNVGRREVDVSRPGPETLASAEPIHQTGALRSPGLDVVDLKKDDELTEILNAPDDLAGETDLPVVGAPLYGQWHAERDRVGSGPAWFDELNRHFRYRIVAGLGAQVVRDHQEKYMERAWNQVGELEEVNRKLRRGQFARATSGRIHDRLVADVGETGTKNVARLLQFTKPVHDKLSGQRITGTGTLGTFKIEFEKRVDFPDAVITSTYRRLSRPNGPLLRNADLGGLSSEQVTPTTAAEDVVDGRITSQNLKKELRPRITTLDDLSVHEWRKQNPDQATDDPVYQQWQMLSGDQTDPAPPPEGDHEVASDIPETNRQLASLDGLPLPGDSAYAPIELSAGISDVSTGADVGHSRRFGTWVGELPEVDLSSVDFEEVQPSSTTEFAVRKVDTQLESSIDHCRAAIEQLESLSNQFPGGGEGTLGESSDDPPSSVYGSEVASEEYSVDETGVREAVSVTEAREVTRSIATNTFQQLTRTLDHLLSTDPESVPAMAEQDMEAFVGQLREDHEAAMTRLDDLTTDLRRVGFDPNRGFDQTDLPMDGVDPNTGDDVGPWNEWNEWIDVASISLLRIVNRLVSLRAGLYQRDGRFEYQSPPRFDPFDSITLLPEEAAGSLMDMLNPERTIPETVLGQVDVGEAAETRLTDREDPIDPVMWAPSFPDPTSDQLATLADEYLLPGIDDVPNNSVGALATNPEVVESFLAGLNHEFARELLWRRFPTDRRGTYFDTFWDTVRNPLSTADDRPTVAEMDTWSSGLGENEPHSGRQGVESNEPDQGGRVVLIIRGELLRRHPNTTIYMIKSKPDDEDADRAGRSPKLDAVGEITQERVENNDSIEHVEFPIFRGNLDPDITYMGFDLKTEKAVGDPEADEPGWFFVFEEPMGETQFGLDHPDEDPEHDPPLGIVDDEKGAKEVLEAMHEQTEEGKSMEAAWNGLAWQHLLSDDESAVEDLNYVRLSGTPPEEENWHVPATLDPENSKSTLSVASHLQDELEELANSFAEWGYNSAHMARITWQRPVRVAIHADDLLVAEDGGSGGNQ